MSARAKWDLPLSREPRHGIVFLLLLLLLPFVWWLRPLESLEVMKCQSFLSFRHAVTTRWMTDSHLLQDQTGVCALATSRIIISPRPYRDFFFFFSVCIVKSSPGDAKSKGVDREKGLWPPYNISLSSCLFLKNDSIIAECWHYLVDVLASYLY